MYVSHCEGVSTFLTSLYGKVGVSDIKPL